jgi:hypothetical protein
MPVGLAVFVISAASGNERRSRRQSASGFQLSTARGADSAITNED